tara:strand:- start:192 stop:1073 length:882 start_codon:yes stop_codon:yes gene_type:complete
MRAKKPKLNHLHNMSIFEIVELMNEEDTTVARIVKKNLPEITNAIELITEKLKKNGRLFYVGAGTSGRIGVMDACECVPTFGTPPELVQSIIAGGQNATNKSQENLEDRTEDGRLALKQVAVNKNDVVVGISASGTTPFVLAAIDYARKKDSATIGFSCSVPSPLLENVKVAIGVKVGPEILSGSTRLKAGTAQKMILNMISTTVMVKLGKVYQNMMVDVKTNNNKLMQRACRIVMKLGEVNQKEASDLLMKTDNQIKTAILMAKLGLNLESANNRLESVGGYLDQILDDSEL